MEAIVRDGAAEVIAIADPSNEAVATALDAANGARASEDLASLLAQDLDGVVIATPSAQHAQQAIEALKAGTAVFCQKPLGRNAREARAVVDAAKAADLLLGVDLSYRHTEGMQRIQRLIREGALGQVFAADLVFHNAYGPDKAWFYDPELSGGGCVMDLGIHLVDLALWCLGFPAVTDVRSALFSKGQRVQGRATVEDYGSAEITLETGTSVRIACSWQAHAGRDAVIELAFYGDRGGAALRNQNGSFYDFVADRFRGTARELLVLPPDAWGGRAAVEWARRLAAGSGFDPSAEQFVTVASTLDRIYAP